MGWLLWLLTNVTFLAWPARGLFALFVLFIPPCNGWASYSMKSAILTPKKKKVLLSRPKEKKLLLWKFQEKKWHTNHIYIPVEPRLNRLNHWTSKPVVCSVQCPIQFSESCYHSHIFIKYLSPIFQFCHSHNFKHNK